MKINMKCFGNLAKDYCCRYDQATPYEVSRQATVKDLLGASGVPEELVKIVFVNGQISESQRQLEPGDNVALAPATGGM